MTSSTDSTTHAPGPGDRPTLRDVGRTVVDSVPRQSLIHLVHLVHLGWQPVFDPTRSWLDWVLVAVILAVFVPAYLVSYLPGEGARHRVLLITIAMGVVATPFNVGAAILFVYAGVFAAQLYGRRALRWHVGLSGVLAVLAVVSTVPFPYRVYGILPSFVFMWLSGQQAVEEQQQIREAERLRIDSVRVHELAAAAERERIARDLHDLLGQSLTGLVVRAQLVHTLVPTDPDAAAQAAADLEVTARAALDQVRAAVGGLREVSLADEVQGARRTLAAAGLAVAIDIPTDIAPNPLVERTLALALREAVTNVIRHAHARDCRIVLTDDGGLWRLEISDDGVGASAPEGNGLRGMRERIAALGGRVDRAAPPAIGRGTTLVVTVPA